MKPITPLLTGLILASMLFGQPPAPQFEVASIRPTATAANQGVSIGLHMDGSQARIAALSIREYIAMAFRVKNYQVSGPSFMADQRFDINATLPAGAKTDQIPVMMQGLLADRFQLKFHREQREFPVYVLVRDSRPLTLKPSAPDATAVAGEVNVAGSGSAAGVSVNLGNGSYYSLTPGKFEAKKLSMASLAEMLTDYVDRPVVNQTGLEGFYDLSFEVTREDYTVMLIQIGTNRGVVLPPQQLQLLDNATRASLHAGLERVGLKLESRKVPQEVIVVDQVLKSPSEN